MPWGVAAAAVIGGVAQNVASKKASKAQGKASDASLAYTKEAADQARGDLFKLYPAAQDNARAGFQGAMDIFGQTVPQQGNLIQQGNVGAQQQLLAGLGQSRNALLGGQFDPSQLQPVTLNANYDFASQQLPQLIDPYAASNNPTQGPLLDPQRDAFLLGGQGGQIADPDSYYRYQQAKARGLT